MKIKLVKKILITIYTFYYLLFISTSFVVLAQEATLEPTPAPIVENTPENTPETTANPTEQPQASPENTAIPTASPITEIETTPIPEANVDPSPEPSQIPLSSPTPVPTPIICTDLVLENCIMESTESADLISDVNFVPTTANPASLNDLPTSSLSADSSDSDSNDKSAEDSDNIHQNQIPSSSPLSNIDVSSSQSNVITIVESNTNSGANTAIGQADSMLSTGNTYAIADLFSLINSLLFGSFIGFEQILVTNSHTDAVDLNLLWQYALNETNSLQNSGSLIADGILILDYQAIVNQLISANANSGENLVDSYSANTQTGDAGASANAATVANTVLNDSTLLFSSVNIIADNGGLIILPRLDGFDQSLISSSGCNSCFNINNNELLAQLNNLAIANTGNNSQIGLFQFMETGNATALANSLFLGNLFYSDQSIFITFINYNPNWQGNIYNWQIEKDSQSNNPTQFIAVDSTTGIENTIPSPTPNLSSGINQSTTLTSTVSANANSGNNQQTALINKMQTGDAVAFANFFGLLNSVFNRSKLFVNFINILSPWQGDIAFAYPDINIIGSINKDSLSPGDTFQYSINCQNQGTDIASNTKVLISTPPYLRLNTKSDFNYIGNNTYEWQVGKLEKNQQRGLTIEGSVDPQFSFADASSSSNSWLVSKVYASDFYLERIVTTQLNASTSDPELNTGNNSTQISTKIYKDGEANESPDSRLPKLNTTIQHNVNKYVYPGDTVSFTAFIRSDGDVVAKEAYAVHTVFDENNKQLFSARFELGDIDPGYEGRLSFGLAIPKGNFSNETILKTRMMVYGKSPNDTWVASPEAWTQFLVKGLNYGTKDSDWQTLDQTITQVGDGQVLAAANGIYQPSPKSIIPRWIWLLLLIPITFGLRFIRKRMLKEIKMQ